METISVSPGGPENISMALLVARFWIRQRARASDLRLPLVCAQAEKNEQQRSLEAEEAQVLDLTAQALRLAASDPDAAVPELEALLCHPLLAPAPGSAPVGPRLRQALYSALVALGNLKCSAALAAAVPSEDLSASGLALLSRALAVDGSDAQLWLRTALTGFKARRSLPSHCAHTAHTTRPRHTHGTPTAHPYSSHP